MSEVKLHTILIIILVILLVFPSQIQNFIGKVTQPTCTDSDGGRDYYVKGDAATDIPNIGGTYDCCKMEYSTNMGDLLNNIGPGGGPCVDEGPYLYEAKCSDSGIPTMEVYECPHGCQEGVCKAKTIECTPNCEGKECGPDGCGSSCGTCPTDKPVCQSGVCKVETIQCTDITWLPDPSTKCEGTTFFQTSNCGNTRTETGIKTTGECATTQECTDTCSSLGYECGTHTICSISTDCGACSSGYECMGSMMGGSKCVGIQPIQQSCQLTNTYWSTTTAQEGNKVILTVEGTNCNEEKVIFDIKEGEVGSDTLIISIQNFEFSNGKAEAEWTSEYIDDGFLQGNPEYYFIAYLSSDNSIKISSNKLTVTKVISILECRDDATCECKDNDGICKFTCTYREDNDCIKPQIWDMVASNNPNDYLSLDNQIIFEKPSDWKNYAPLKNKVLELTNSLTTDEEKVQAIAKWVKSSKPYGHPSPGQELESGFGSVIEIFDYPNGVCFDSSIIITAMIRLAGIPARSVLPAVGMMHEYNEVFINGKWVGLDATFGLGEPLFDLDSTGLPLIYVIDEGPNLDSSEISTMGGAFIGTNIKWYKSKRIPVSVGSRILIDAQKAEIPPVPNDMGELLIPITEDRAYCNMKDDGNCYLNRILNTVPNLPYVMPEQLTKSLEILYHMDWWPGEFLMNPPSCWFSTNNFACSTYECRKTEDSLKYLIPFQVSFYFTGYRNGERLRGGGYKKAGYTLEKLPSGNYRVNCGFEYLKSIAFKDIEIKKGERVVVSPDSLIKVDGITQNNFDVLITLLKQSTDLVTI